MGSVYMTCYHCLSLHLSYVAKTLTLDIKRKKKLKNSFVPSVLHCYSTNDLCNVVPLTLTVALTCRLQVETCWSDEGFMLILS